MRSRHGPLHVVRRRRARDEVIASATIAIGHHEVAFSDPLAEQPPFVSARAAGGSSALSRAPGSFSPGDDCFEDGSPVAGVVGGSVAGSAGFPYAAGNTGSPSAPRGCFPPVEPPFSLV